MMMKKCRILVWILIFAIFIVNCPFENMVVHADSVSENEIDESKSEEESSEEELEEESSEEDSEEESSEDSSSEEESKDQSLEEESEEESIEEESEEESSEEELKEKDSDAVSNELTYEDSSVKVIVKALNESTLSEDIKLSVSMITADSDEHAGYVDKTEEVLKLDNSVVSYAEFLNIAVSSEDSAFETELILNVVFKNEIEAGESETLHFIKYEENSSEEIMPINQLGAESDSNISANSISTTIKGSATVGMLLSTEKAVSNTKTLTYDTGDFSVAVTYDSNAQIPEGTSLKVPLYTESTEYQYYHNMAITLLVKNTDTYISDFVYGSVNLMYNEEIVELASSVNVTANYQSPLQKDADETLYVLVFDENHTASVISSEEVISETDVETGAEYVSQVKFSIDRCRAVGIVLLKDLTTGTSGEANAESENGNCSVNAVFGEDAGFPKNIQLNVAQVSLGGSEYKEYLEASYEMLEDASVVHADFYDVSFMLNNQEKEPAKGAEVTVTFSMKNGFVMGTEQLLKVVHFLDNGEYELIVPQIEEQELTEEGNYLIKKISFKLNSFSVIGIIIFDKGAVTVLNVEGEQFSNVTSKKLTKTWISWDGKEETEKHSGDKVTVELQEVETGSDGKDTYHTVSTADLNASGNWTYEFTGLNPAKTYRIVETAVTSDNTDVKDIYRSELSSGIVYHEEWTLVNELVDGEYYLLQNADNNNVLRTSTSTISVESFKNTAHTRYESSAVSVKNFSILRNSGLTSIYKAEKQEDGTWKLNNQGRTSYSLGLFLNEKDELVWRHIDSSSYEGTKLTITENGKISASVTKEDKKETGWFVFPKDNTNGSKNAVAEEEAATVKFYQYSMTILGSDASLVNRKNYTPSELAFSVSADVGKTIDYLGDKAANPDTDADTSSEEKILQDLYRLNLDFTPRTDATGLDLVVVLDVSSSMRDNSIKYSDNTSMTRADALVKAMESFIPDFLSDSNNRNRLSVVVFENEAMVLQDWTQDPAEALAKVKNENLMKGSGTNYEAALMRAHEAFADRGISTNRKAMIFLSDGDPTRWVKGNDKEEPGNVTISLGNEIKVGSNGPEGKFPPGLAATNEDTAKEISKNSTDSITSFRYHNQDVVIGTIAFETIITSYLQKLATHTDYVKATTNATPQDLLNAMNVITQLAPSGIAITDELSAYVELYENDPDYKAIMTDENGNVTVLYENGALTTYGKATLDNEKPIVFDSNNRTITMRFNTSYIPVDNNKYTMSFNIRPSQKAFDQYADASGAYTDKGQTGTDYHNNTTSSEKDGFFSNGTNTRAVWQYQGAETAQYYPKPVIQVRDGTLTVHKTDNETKTASLAGAGFTLYRKAENDRENTVLVEGLTGSYVKVAEGVTGADGSVKFEHLRLTVFDTGYHYYLVETNSPEGYSRYMKPIGLTLYQDKVVLDDTNDSMIAVMNDAVGINVGNEASVMLNLTKVAMEDTSKVLAGAEFVIYRLICSNNSHDHNGLLDPGNVNADCWKLYGTETSGTDGTLCFNLPVNSSYRLIETKAPGGYVLPEGQWSLSTSINGETKTISIDNAVAGVSGLYPPAFINGENSNSFKVVNKMPIDIPVTGGNGIAGFKYAGLLMMLCGMMVCMVCFTKKKAFHV